MGVKCDRGLRLCKEPEEGHILQYPRYSFENIDKFMTSSLITRITTDVTNVQCIYDADKNCHPLAPDADICIRDGLCDGGRMA